MSLYFTVSLEEDRVKLSKLQQSKHDLTGNIFEVTHNDEINLLNPTTKSCNKFGFIILWRYLEKDYGILDYSNKITNNYCEIVNFLEKGFSLPDVPLWMIEIIFKVDNEGQLVIVSVK